MDPQAEALRIGLREVVWLLLLSSAASEFEGMAIPCSSEAYHASQATDRFLFEINVDDAANGRRTYKIFSNSTAADQARAICADASLSATTCADLHHKLPQEYAFAVTSAVDAVG